MSTWAERSGAEELALSEVEGDLLFSFLDVILSEAEESALSEVEGTCGFFPSHQPKPMSS